MSSTPSPPAPALAPGWTLFTAAIDDDEPPSPPPPPRSRARAKPRLVTARDVDRSGTVLAGQWELLRLLGRGGMGAVYEAFYRADRRRYAVKILFEDQADDPVTVERFRHEFWALSQVEHPGVVGVHAFDDEHLFYSMELLRGRALDDVVHARPLAPAKVVDLGLQLCEIFAAAHERGVIHRDIKPGNLMLLEDGRVKVLDFGVAKLLPRFYAIGEQRTPPEDRLRTRAGVALGTPGYMAPEIGLGEAPAPRHDVFALGVTLFRLATCKMPYPELPPAVVGDEPRWTEELGAAIPGVLETVLRRAMSSDPGGRIQTMADLRVELDDVRAELAADEGEEIAEGSAAGPMTTEREVARARRAEARTVAVEGVAPRDRARALPWVLVGVIALVLVIEVLAHHGPWHEESRGRGWGPIVVAVPTQSQPSTPVDQETPAMIPGSESGAADPGAAPIEDADPVRAESDAVTVTTPPRRTTGGSRSLTRAEVVTEALTREAPELRRCLPGGETEAIDLVIGVGPDGAVTSIALEGPRLPKVTHRCVEERLRGSRFPASGRSTSHRHRLLTPTRGSPGE